MVWQQQMAAVPRSFAVLLEKAVHYDKDERFMAINDLNAELQKDMRMDGALEKRICDTILDRLEKDTSNDVQAVSVKWSVWM